MAIKTKPKDTPPDWARVDPEDLPRLAKESGEALFTLPKPVGRPASGKVVVSLRLEPEVVKKFRATGPGWQARMNDVLKAAKV